MTKLRTAYLCALLLASACAPTEQINTPGKPIVGDNCPIIQSTDWTAWINAEPPGPRQLIIRGAITLPTPGYDVSWRLGAADKRLPPVQHMHLDIAPPTGIVAQVVVTAEAYYAGEATYPEYRSIVIHCGDEVLAEISPVPVAH